MRQTPKCLIWDFDGVLCDSLNKAVDIHNVIAKQKIVEVPFVSSRDSYSACLDNFFKSMDDQEIDKYYLAHRELMYEHRKEFPLFCAIIRFIINCRIPSVILTATYEKLVVDVLKNNDIDYLVFKEIIGREIPGNKLSKIKSFLEKYNLQNYEVLAIGDSPSDMTFCHCCGIPFIAVGYGYYSFEVFDVTQVVGVCKTEYELINLIQTYCEL